MFYHLFGALILLINKMRYSIFGYSRPRPFSVSDIDRAVNYDLNVFSGWMNQLKKYSDQSEAKNKNILELGPGADLGNAFIAIAQGAASYTAFDANSLAKNCPDILYEKLFTVLTHKFGVSLNELREELKKLKNNSGRIQYICDKNFNLSILADRKFDFIFSQAAFEHFENVENVIVQLSQLASPGAILAAEIDLQTHTQIIRYHDPLNIYRFSDNFYRFCHFTGIPNRKRPQAYEDFLKNNDWTDIKLIPLNLLDTSKVEKIRPELNRKFSDDPHLGYLSFMLLATK